MYLDPNSKKKDVNPKDDVGATKAYKAWFVAQHPLGWMVKHSNEEEIGPTPGEGCHIRRR